ncbi:hypothetical protein Tsubulata_013275 [Turnera subulata]|uniref:Chromo domain-containing protein n=1 Tax=Turnera subulata TaxID=218843 RepID=A0A9Q0JB21_9ROSI|nr:hypothetical protein Tsubulata_013275 [Turnera subulata]
MKSSSSQEGVTASGYLPEYWLTNLILQPAAILQQRFLQNHGQTTEQWLVQWEGLPTSEAKWENKEQLCRSFPSLNLEDKVLFEGGSNVVNVDLVNELSDRPANTEAQREGNDEDNCDIEAQETMSQDSRERGNEIIIQPRRSNRLRVPSRILAEYDTT